MKRLPSLFLVLALAASAAHALDYGAERARIAQQRKEVEARLSDEETACRARFAVTDCVKAARAKHRSELSELRRQEVAVNDLERKDRAARRLKEAEERSALERQELAAQQRLRAQAQQQAREARSADKSSRKVEPQPGERAVSREFRAQERATQKAHAQEGRAAEEAENRREYEKKVEQAEAHKASVQKRLAERKKPAASDLPPPKP